MVFNSFRYQFRKTVPDHKVLGACLLICLVGSFLTMRSCRTGDGFALSELCPLDLLSYATSQRFTAQLLSMVALFLSYRLISRDFWDQIQIRFVRRSNLFLSQWAYLTLFFLLWALLLSGIIVLYAFCCTELSPDVWVDLQQALFASRDVQDALAERGIVFSEALLPQISELLGQAFPVRVALDSFLCLYSCCILAAGVIMAGCWLKQERWFVLLYVGFCAYESIAYYRDGVSLIFADLRVCPSDYLYSFPEAEFLFPLLLWLSVAGIGYFILDIYIPGGGLRRSHGKKT